MTIREQIQNAIIAATKARELTRLETLRMAKGALLVKEKAKNKLEDMTDEDVVETLRAEVRKRRQSMEIYAEHGKEEEVEALRTEISVIEEFLPRQLSEEEIEERVRTYRAEHPEINHAGKFTGIMKKELGDEADGKILNVVCRRVLGQ